MEVALIALTPAIEDSGLSEWLALAYKRSLRGIGSNMVPKDVPEIGEIEMRKREKAEQGNAQQQENQKRWCRQQESCLARFSQLNSWGNNRFKSGCAQFNCR